MSTVSYISAKQSDEFLKKNLYVLIYVRKTFDSQNESLNTRIQQASVKYPSVIVRAIDYVDLCSERGYVDRSRYMILSIYFKSKMIKAYYDPNQILILKIFHAIYDNVPPSNFGSFVISLDKNKVHIKSKSIIALKRPYNLENSEPIKSCKKRKKLLCNNELETMPNEQLEIYRAAEILCSFKNPNFTISNRSQLNNTKSLSIAGIKCYQKKLQF